MARELAPSTNNATFHTIVSGSSADEFEIRRESVPVSVCVDDLHAAVGEGLLHGRILPAAAALHRRYQSDCGRGRVAVAVPVAADARDEREVGVEGVVRREGGEAGTGHVLLIRGHLGGGCCCRGGRRGIGIADTVVVLHVASEECYWCFQFLIQVNSLMMSVNHQMFSPHLNPESRVHALCLDEAEAAGDEVVED